MQKKDINGSLVSKILLEELRDYLSEKKVMPSIVDISIGNDFGGLKYAQMKEKRINKETGIDFRSVHFEEINQNDLIDYINNLNNDQNISGIMLQLPLPDYLKEYQRYILDTIDPSKDVDGLTSYSMGKLVVGENSFIPCTALGILVLLQVYGIDLIGKKVAIINRSNIVGKPLFHLLLNENAVPIVCHSKVKFLSKITLDCDIIVAALNKQEYINSRYVKDEAILIDVGVHKNNVNKTVGDIAYDEVYDKASLITPPVGGVGPMTVCMLAYNSAKSLYSDEVDEVLKLATEKAKVLVRNNNGQSK